VAIHIRPENRGKYTARAKAHGKTPAAQAAADLKPGSGATPLQRKRANFARNARKWNRSKRKTRRSR
jgi:hypothetical protein